MKIFTIVFALLCVSNTVAQETPTTESQILQQMKYQASSQLMDKWYPLVLDYKDGGYFSEISYDFKVGTNQDKMIITQSRHLWGTSKAGGFYKDRSFLDYADHGFEFLKSKMWDAVHGGFYDLVNKKGGAHSK